MNAGGVCRAAPGFARSAKTSAPCHLPLPLKITIVGVFSPKMIVFEDFFIDSICFLRNQHDKTNTKTDDGSLLRNLWSIGSPLVQYVV